MATRLIRPHFVVRTLAVALMCLARTAFADEPPKPPAAPATAPARTEAVKFNAPAAVDRVRVGCKPATKMDFVGAKIEGSNVSRTDGFVTVAEIKDAPAGSGWDEVKFENARVFRWVRFSLPDSAKSKLGRVEFHVCERLLDSDSKGAHFRVFGAGGVQSDRAIGSDLFDSAVAQRVSFKPDTSDLAVPTDVTMQSTRGAVIRYTRDGSWPTAEHGEIYSAPIRIGKNTTLSAVAILPERAPHGDVDRSGEPSPDGDSRRAFRHDGRGAEGDVRLVHEGGGEGVRKSRAITCNQRHRGAVKTKNRR